MSGSNLKLICKSWLELYITLNPPLPIKPFRKRCGSLSGLEWPVISVNVAVYADEQRVQMKEEWKRFLSTTDGMMSDLPPLAPN